MSRGEFDRIMAKLVAVFNRPMPESTGAAWYAEVTELKFERDDLQTAVDGLCRLSERHPSLAQLITATRDARRKRLAAAPVLAGEPGRLPDGVVALIHSQYQDVAVMGTAPWWLSQVELPAGIVITGFTGAQPRDWSAAA